MLCVRFVADVTVIGDIENSSGNRHETHVASDTTPGMLTKQHSDLLLGIHLRSLSKNYRRNVKRYQRRIAKQRQNSIDDLIFAEAAVYNQMLIDNEAGHVMSHRGSIDVNTLGTCALNLLPLVLKSLSRMPPNV